jgi:Co/Zn/Cd efflux system component
MCIDATSFLISVAAIYLAKKRPTKKLSFGYIRAGLMNIVFFGIENTLELFFRSSGRVSECTNDMVGDWNSCVYGYSTLY